MINKVLLDMFLRKNLGDDIFLKIISERYPNTIFYTLPQCDYNKSYYKDNVVFKRNIFTRLFNVLFKKTGLNMFSVIGFFKKKIEYLISLGGSIFIKNKTKNIDNLIDVKYFQNEIPYFILGSNFGPYNSNHFYESYYNVFREAEDVCFRDKYSYNLFKDLKNVRYTRDIVFTLDTKKYSNKDTKKVVISVIDLSKRSDICEYKEAYEKQIENIANYFINNKYKVVLMSFCKGEGDENAIDRISKNLNSKNVSTYYYDGNIDEAINEIASSEYVVATRFHAMILGLLFGKKVLPIIYSNKTLNTINDLKFNSKYLELSSLGSFDISKEINNIKKYDGNINNISKEAEKHFEKLNKYIN